MGFLPLHTKAFKAEWLKLKHSGMFWLCFGAALFIPLLNTTVSFFVNVGETAPDTNHWNLLIENNFRTFTGFFFPVFLVLMVVRLVYLEHRSDTWKLLETQPVHKAWLFLAKWETAALISLFCLAGLFVFSLFGGTLLMVFRKTYHLDKHTIDWAGSALIIFRFWVASLAIISFQYFLGLWIKSFAWPMGIGLIAIIAGSIFAGFGILTWWPYSASVLTAVSYQGSVTGNYLLHHEKLSLLWSLLFLWLGYQYFTRKTMHKAFFSSLKRAGSFAAVLSVFLLLAWMITRPSVLPPYNKTVIAGRVSAGQKINSVVLLAAPAFDTVALLPVVNGKFRTEIKELPGPGIYYLRAGDFRSEVFLGANDSLFIELKTERRGTRASISGTRVAENAYLQENSNSTPRMLTDYAYQYKPGLYAVELMEEWEKGKEKMDDFKTVDNIKPRPDFIEAQKKLLAISLVTLADYYYPQIHAVYYPNEQLKYPSILNKLRKEAQINDSSLVTFGGFRNFVATSLYAKSNQNDSLYLAFLHKDIKNEKVKNYVLFEAVQNTVFRIKDSVKRRLLFQQALPALSNQKLRHHLLQTDARMQSLQRGKKAPNFRAEAINAAFFDLNKLTNRYVVLDVWATWCGPCKREAPYFNELAERYTNEQIAFVSVSIDENKHAWKMEAAGKKGKVLQLWALNAEEDFAKRFAVSSIPRFMLLDPKGNIIHAELPLPSDPQFEAILQREIPFLSNHIL